MQIDPEYLLTGRPMEEPEGFAEDFNYNQPDDPDPVSSTKKQRIFIRDMAFAMLPQANRDWIIENLAAAGNVIIFSAWTGSGKTWIAYAMAVCVSLGLPIMGFNTVQSACLIVNEEMDEYDLFKRLTMCNRARFGNEKTPVKMVSFARFNLFSEKTAAIDACLLEGLIIETGARFIVIDALADIMQGGDENAVKDTQAVFMRLSEISKHTRCAIMVIHHTGKNGTTRGSSAIPGAVDLAIIGKRTPESDYINFETEKARIIPNMKWSAKMTWTEDQFYIERVERDNANDQLTPKEKTVIEYLENCNPPGATTKQIEGETGVSRYIVINLSKREKIHRIDGGGAGKVATYEVKHDNL